MIIYRQPRKVPNRRVIITVSEDSIDIDDEINRVEWSVTVGLNDEGRCILKLKDGTELEQWQFRKKALESLFFGEKGRL